MKPEKSAFDLRVYLTCDCGTCLWWAATVTACCPDRMVEHPKSKSTGGCYQADVSPCTYNLHIHHPRPYSRPCCSLTLKDPRCVRHLAMCSLTPASRWPFLPTSCLASLALFSDCGDGDLRRRRRSPSAVAIGALRQPVRRSPVGFKI